MTEPIDLSAALARLDTPWSPRTVAVLNDYDIRVVKTSASSPDTATRRPMKSSSFSVAR